MLSINMNIETNKKYNINQLSKILYDNLDNNIEYIYNYNINDLLKLKNNGILSLLIQYYIKLNDNYNINYIIDNIKFNNLILLKRDYLNIIKFYYNLDNEELYKKYFDQLLFKFNNNSELLLNKDIDFILNNKLYNLLLHFDGYFIKTSNNDHSKLSEYAKLKLYGITSDIINTYLYYIENKIHKNILLMINNLLIKINHENNSNELFILDAGNILNNYMGTITNKSLINLENIINLLIIKKNKLLIIIHNKHIKNLINLEKILKNKKCFYFLNPYIMVFLKNA